MKLYFLHVGNVHCFLYLGNKKQYRDVHKRKKVSYGPKNTDIKFPKNQYINKKVCKKGLIQTSSDQRGGLWGHYLTSNRKGVTC